MDSEEEPGLEGEETEGTRVEQRQAWGEMVGLGRLEWQLTGTLLLSAARLSSKSHAHLGKLHPYQEGRSKQREVHGSRLPS